MWLIVAHANKREVTDDQMPEIHGMKALDAVDSMMPFFGDYYEAKSCNIEIIQAIDESTQAHEALVALFNAYSAHFANARLA